MCPVLMKIRVIIIYEIMFELKIPYPIAMDVINLPNEQIYLKYVPLNIVLGLIFAMESFY